MSTRTVERFEVLSRNGELLSITEDFPTAKKMATIAVGGKGRVLRVTLAVVQEEQIWPQIENDAPSDFPEDA